MSGFLPTNFIPIASLKYCSSLRFALTVRDCVPPPQVAEHSLHAPVSHENVYKGRHSPDTRTYVCGTSRHAPDTFVDARTCFHAPETLVWSAMSAPPRGGERPPARFPSLSLSRRISHDWMLPAKHTGTTHRRPHRRKGPRLKQFWPLRSI